MRFAPILFVFSFIASCFISKDPNELQSPLFNTYDSKKGKTHTDLRGTWQSIGHGYILDVKEDSSFLYSYTESFCYKEYNDYLEGLINSQSKFELRGDTIGLYLTDYGSKSRMLQTKKDFIRLGELPENCVTRKTFESYEPPILYNAYRETMIENYAFATERNVVWSELFESSLSDSIQTDEELFSAMGHAATETKDQHTKVISKDGTSLQYRVTPSALVVQSTFEEQQEIENLNDYFNLFFEKNKSNISDILLAGKGKKVLNEKIEWGKVGEDVGYIKINAFAGFLDRSHTRLQQLDSIEANMNRIIQSLQSTQGIIIDVSLNFGGYDASALTIAGYFTNKPTYAYSAEVFYERTFYKEDDVIVHPAKLNYQKPVYLVTTDISRSAAENFAMMMDALPNITIVGSTTLGTLSGMLGKSIGNYYTTFSNQRFTNAKGEYFEVSGVTPDIPIAVFPKEDVMNGHKNTILEIVNLIKQRNPVMQ